MLDTKLFCYLQYVDVDDFVHVRGYECLPETVISLAGIAQPNYKLSANCVSSEQCTYNRVLKKSRYLL